MHTSLQHLLAGGRLRSISGKKLPVILAQAGIHSELATSTALWVPAFVGTTGKMDRKFESMNPPATDTKHCKLVCIR